MSRTPIEDRWQQPGLREVSSGPEKHVCGCGCGRGRAFAIEAKVDGRPTTETQDLRLKEWEEAGAVTVVAREDFDAAAFLKRVCRELEGIA